MSNSISSASLLIKTRKPWRDRLFPNYEWALLLVVLLECAIFSFTGNNFLTSINAFEVVRSSVEIGLLALALTPVIISGGIDLSVGSMMGLAAVVFGSLWRDAHLPLPIAVGITLLIGLAGGGLNGLLIARLKLPPLIVTLGTFSLFRGIAEGLTRGIENYSGFPSGFLFWGQGYMGGVIPAQLPILFTAVTVVAWCLHRTAFGRTLYAIGYSAEGSRYAGVPVARRLSIVYLMSGLASSLAAVIYVAHLGQAKSDAGTGYELLAITAVVLGGASIAGGRGTVFGTVLGLYAIVLLENGLRLSGGPAELTGVLTGILLLMTVAVNRFVAPTRSKVLMENATEELEMKNSQVAVLTAAILAGARLVAGSNWLLVRSMRSDPSGGRAGDAAGTASSDSGAGAAHAHRIQIAIMPKAKGDPYFISCRQGAEQAAKELGIDLLWDGPTDLDPARQNEVVESWITRGVDVIAVSVENKAGISTVLRKAKAKGIRVITWDADAEPDARDFFINQATPEGIGSTLMDNAARILGGKGEFAIITASLTAANMIEWQKYIEARRAEKYPDIKMAALRPCDDLKDKAFAEATAILNANPQVKLLMAICSPAVPGASEAVKQSGRKDVKDVGLGLPNDNKRYVREEITPSVILWNTGNLGYLTVQAAVAV